MKARQAVAESAAAANAGPLRLLKDRRGVPLPDGDCFWSLSHKPLYVAGVVAPFPVGIDIERIRPVTGALLRKTADEREWTSPDDPLFFRFWTAKESVLKACGDGLKGLSSCRVVGTPDAATTEIAYRERIWRISHCFFDGHVAGVVSETAGIQWLFPEKNPAAS